MHTELLQLHKEKKMARNIHVVMLPWSAFGHIIPFLQLSISLAKAGVRVSFISTPKNIQRLPKLPPSTSALIDLVELPMPEIDRNLLLENAEATVDIPFEKIQYLKTAYDLLQQPFKQFIESQPPDWIIVDVMPNWVVQIAQDHAVPLLFFSAYSAATVAFLGPPEHLVGEKRVRSSPESMTSPPEWVNFPSSVAYRKYEAIGFYNAFFKVNESGVIDAERYAKILSSCQVVAIRSCEEAEGEYLTSLTKILKKPVIPVGLKLVPPERIEEREFADGSWTNIFKWLDEQKNGSVVFVGFGSECKLSKDHVHEIAYGLEVSELPFLWALRKPDWATEDLDALPVGFRHRNSGKGVVHIGWAPQVEILGHPSVGGSLFHSGWGSVIETLQFGHCLVVLPFIVDQGLNARLMVEKGLAIEVERNEEDGSFGREDVAKALREAMVSEKGERLRSRARETGAIFGDQKLNDQYMEGFVEYLKRV